LVHQFRLIAQRTKALLAPAARGKGRGWWRRWQAAPKRALGLAAVKHAQQQARPPPVQQRFELPLPYPVDCGWPDNMKRELDACRTPADYHAWSQKWALELNGEAAQRRRDAVRPVRPPPCGLCGHVPRPAHVGFR
jgi:hypothetical protein